MKNMRPSEWTLSSQPSGKGPKSSSGFRLCNGVVNWFGIGLALPVLGSTHEVVLSLWSIKKILPLGATCIDQPCGNPSVCRFGFKLFEEVESRLDVLVELSVVSSVWNKTSEDIHLCFNRRWRGFETLRYVRWWNDASFFFLFVLILISWLRNRVEY